MPYLSALRERLPPAQDINFDIDAHLNRFILPSPLHKFPKSISRFFGYRTTVPQDVGNILIAAWALVGTVAGLILVASVVKYNAWIQVSDPPVLIASLGAAAVLEYNAIMSPLAQPRNSIFGHTLSAFIGVVFAKIMLLSDTPAQSLSWLIAPLACGTASALMTLLNSVYPPGGASAILAVADPQVRKLGWIFVLLVFLSSLLMLSVALIFNNIQRRYPVWWWTPLEAGHAYRRRRESDVEKLTAAKSESSGESVFRGQDLPGAPAGEAIVVAANGLVSVPHNIHIDEHERAVLQGLLEKLQAQNYGQSVTEMSWAGDEPP